MTTQQSYWSSQNKLGTDILIGNQSSNYPDDLVLLRHFHEPTVVECLHEQLLPNKFDVPMAAHQLRCGGIIQAVSVTRSGFTLHYSHDDFIKRYGIIVGRRVPSGRASTTAIRDVCLEMVEQLLK
jgi:hypothetical protein